MILNRTLDCAEARWPTMGFLSLGLMWGWLDVQTSSFTLFPPESSGNPAGLETYLYWFSLFMTVAILLGVLLYRKIDASFKRPGAFVAAACLLSGSIVVSAAIGAGWIPAGFVWVGAGLAGVGAAWFMMSCANAYINLKAKDLFVSVGLSKIIGIAYYFVTVSLPSALSLLSLALTPVIVAIFLCRINCPKGPPESTPKTAGSRGTQNFFARTTDEFSALGISKKSVLKLSVVCFVVFFIAVLTKQEGLAASDLDASAMSFQLINFGTLLLSLLFVLIVVAPPKQELIALTKGFYAAMAVIVILFIATTLGSYHSPAFSWITGSLRNMLDAVVFAISALLIRRLHTSTAQTYGLICGFPVCLGGFFGHALVNTSLFAGTEQMYYLTLGIDLVAVILLFTVFTPRDLELLFAVGIAELPAADERHQPERAEEAFDDIVAEANFSTREAEVFALLMDGYTIRLISQALHISQSTVKTHISKIYLKTNVATREELFIKLKSPGSKEAVGGKKPGNA